VKSKIICIFIVGLLIITTLPVIGKTMDNNGSTNTNHEIAPNFNKVLKPKQSLRGLRVIMIWGMEWPQEEPLVLESWGAEVDLISAAAISFDELKSYHIIWIHKSASPWINNYCTDGVIRDLVYYGVGLIFCQPNYAHIPKCLPYTWEIIDNEPMGCAGAMLDPNHPLCIGLTIDDMPDCADTVGEIDSNYTILTLSELGVPCFACAEYGSGKIIIQMNSALGFNEDSCGDEPPLSPEMVYRMFEWARRSKSVDLTDVETIQRPILKLLQSYPFLFPVLQKLKQNLGQ